MQESKKNDLALLKLIVEEERSQRNESIEHQIDCNIRKTLFHLDFRYPDVRPEDFISIIFEGFDPNNISYDTLESRVCDQSEGTHFEQNGKYAEGKYTLLRSYGYSLLAERLKDLDEGKAQYFYSEACKYYDLASHIFEENYNKERADRILQDRKNGGKAKALKYNVVKEKVAQLLLNADVPSGGWRTMTHAFTEITEDLETFYKELQEKGFYVSKSNIISQLTKWSRTDPNIRKAYEQNARKSKSKM